MSVISDLLKVGLEIILRKLDSILGPKEERHFKANSYSVVYTYPKQYSLLFSKFKVSLNLKDFET